MTQETPEISGTPEHPLGRKMTWQEESDYAWYKAAYNDTAKTLHESLRQLLTLNAALLGGSIALLNSMAHWPRALLVVSLLVSVFAALWGVMPRTASFPDAYADLIRAARVRNDRIKTSCLNVALASLGLAFLFGVWGTLAR